MQPVFRKPKHKEKVIATNRGWVVERTGELLSRVHNLVDKLAELGVEVEVVEPVIEPAAVDALNTLLDEIEAEPSLDGVEQVIDEVVEVAPTEVVALTVDVAEVVDAPAPKKRGRPAKAK